MSTPETCIARAEEAERLAALVSYERDRVRLTRQAAEWRERAEALRAEPGPAAPSPPRRSWLQRLFVGRRSHGG